MNILETGDGNDAQFAKMAASAVREIVEQCFPNIDTEVSTYINGIYIFL